MSEQPYPAAHAWMLCCNAVSELASDVWHAPKSRLMASQLDLALRAMTSDACDAGREVREQLFSQVTALFHDLDMGMLPVSVLLPYLPIPAHNRRDR